ncbi:MAG: hypothetical protein Ct9H300mP3_07890 [Gammaproteobacteria bacterium]|nr:MAG: hypothetical protein Ct9H300mP3_07890 [Gammaproteobacteria bacterium]
MRKAKPLGTKCIKITRQMGPPMPEDLVKQIEPINQIFEALGIKLLSIKGGERQMMKIGTLPKRSKRSRFKYCYFNRRQRYDSAF